MLYVETTRTSSMFKRRWAAKKRLGNFAWVVAYGFTKRSAVRNLRRMLQPGRS